MRTIVAVLLRQRKERHRTTAFSFLAVSLPITPMDAAANARLAYLHSQLADARSERNRLAREIHSRLTTPARKSRISTANKAARACTHHPLIIIRGEIEVFRIP